MRQDSEDSTFNGLWPYEPRWFNTRVGRLYYVDEGPQSGRPVVLVHGNPTWGFLYRHFIGPLTAGHRVIVPRHLGFGRSGKPNRPDIYRTPEHARRLDALLESLDLSDAVVAPQDWEGPTGLSCIPSGSPGLFLLNVNIDPMSMTVDEIRFAGESRPGEVGAHHQQCGVEAGVMPCQRMPACPGGWRLVGRAGPPSNQAGHRHSADNLQKSQ